jgi:hypothetical protein
MDDRVDERGIGEGSPGAAVLPTAVGADLHDHPRIELVADPLSR